jgi:hypothetical protein
MDTTCTAITTEDSLEFHGLGWESSRLDMTGIQYFDNLKYLDFSANCIDPYSLGASSLDPGLAYLVLPASLLVVKCRNLVSYGIGITSGERFLLPNGLEYLDYSGCRSKVRLNSPPSLKYLDCSGNSLTDIGVLPATLDTLICYDQERYEGINFYSLGGIPALPAGLRYLDCHSNSVSNLPPLPNSLTWLDCSGMVYHSSEGINVPRLDSLPALPSSLQYLNCGGNRLTKLPVLPASYHTL